MIGPPRHVQAATYGVMPAEFTLATLPEPLDPAVRFREVPGRKVAELRTAMAKAGLRAEGEPVWARYDPPFMPWFLRTNEILVELAP